jgi:GAF domain-containing protein
MGQLPVPALDLALQRGGSVALVEPEAAEAALAMPLKLHDQIIGALGIQETDEARKWSSDEVALVEAVSEQVALALESARLFEETRRRTEELALVNRIVSTAASSLDSHETLNVVAAELIDTFSLDHVGVALLNEERTALTIMADKSRAPDAPSAVGIVLPLEGNPSSQQVIATRRPLVIPDAQHNPLTASIHDVMRWRGTQTLIILPLIAGGEVIGTFGLDIVETDQTFTPDEMRLAETIVAQASTAIQNAQLFEQTRRRAEEQQGLARIAALAGSTLDLDELLAHLVDETVQLLGAESGVLLVLDEDEKTLVGRYLSHEARLRLGSMEWRVPLDAPGFEQSIFARGGTYYTNQAQADPNIVTAYLPYVEALGAENFCGVALRVRDRSVGEFYVADRPEGFGQEQARLLSTVVGYVANAIENARLFEQTQEQVEHLSALHRAVQSVSAALDPDVLTGKLVDEARRLVGADYGALVVLDPATGGIQYFKTAGIEEGSCPLTEIPRGRGLLKLVLEGQTVRVDDIREHPSYGNYLPAGHLPIVSFMGLPLIYQNQVRGLLAVSNRANRPTFDQGDENLLGTFATQATVTLENARLFEQTQEALTETEALYSASWAIGAATSSAEVGQALMNYAATSGVNAVRVLLLEHDEQGLPAQMVMHEGWTVDDRPTQPYGTRLPMKDYPLADFMNPNKPVVVEDVLTDPRANEMTRTLIATISGLRSFAMVPITVGNRWIGTIFAGCDEPGPFAEELVRSYWTLAGQAAVALDNMRLLEDTRRHLEHITTLYEIGQEITSTLDLDSMLQTIADDAARLAGCQQTLIALLDAEKQELLHLVGHGYGQEHLQEITFEELWHGLTGWVMREKKPTLTRDMLEDERETDEARERSQQTSIGSVAVAPLMVKGQVIGTLTGVNPSGGPVFAQEDLDMLVLLSSQAAIAIENVRLFEESRIHAEELAVLNELSQALTRLPPAGRHQLLRRPL